MSLSKKISLLFVLYLVQGLPYGLQISTLPVLLRSQGVSLTTIGFASLLAVPWTLKALWSPIVDRWWSPRLGRRRSWLLPLLGLLAASFLVAAPVASSFNGLVAMVLVLNLIAATLDIAVDGLAIDLLDDSELGPGNIAQVVGFKVGMIFGGGLALVVAERFSQEKMFIGLAAVVCVGLVVALRFREPAAPLELKGEGFTGIVSRLLAVLRRKESLWLLLFVSTYKLGESLADMMFRPFLVDSGFSASEIGLLVGTWGVLASIVGSIGGGLMSRRLGLWHGLAVAAVLRCFGVAAVWWLSLQAVPSSAAVLVVTVIEHALGGALTTATFAYMMSRVDRRIGATHYTVLAAFEVWGKLSIFSISGWLVDTSSYQLVFASATLISVMFLALLLPLRES